MTDLARELAADTVALLRALIANRCVNDGTADSGKEFESVRTLQAFLRESAIDYEIVEPHSGRASLVARLPGTDPHAPSLLLLGHLDVVPVGDDTWQHDPFGAELIDGEIWGRGAIDMLTLTASMATVTRLAADPAHRPAGDLIFAAVADEEAGGHWGARWMVEHRPDLITADRALTEQGGVLLDRHDRHRPGITVGIGEKGSAPRKLLISGRAGHGSVPSGAHNAAGIAAEVVLHLMGHQGPPRILPHWVSLVRALGLAPDLSARLLDPETIDGALPELGGLAPLGEALTRMTIAPTIVRAGIKRNIIPGTASVELDIRVLPGQVPSDVDSFLAETLAPWAECVRIDGDSFQPGSLSSAESPLFARIVSVLKRRYPGAVPAEVIGPGGSDGRFLRPLGTEVYGFGLFSREIELADFRQRLHARDERVDVGSVELTALGLADVVLGTSFVEPEPRR